MPVTQTLHNSSIQENREGKEGIYEFICCVRNGETSAAVSALEGKAGLVRLIAKFAIPQILTEDSCHYKVKIDMCTGTEHVHVEALKNKGGWESLFNTPPGTDISQVYGAEWSGSLSNQTIGGACFVLDGWIRQAAFLTNDDGSFLSEGQLRAHFGTYMRRTFCSSVRCGGKCCALPGDTIFWRFDYPYRFVARWESATDEELRERGWMNQGGMLARSCELFREDPTQLDNDGEGNEA